MNNLKSALRRAGIGIVAAMVLLVVACGTSSGGEGSTVQNKSVAPGKPALGEPESSATVSDAKILLTWTVPEAGKTAEGTDASIARYYLYWKAGATVSETDNEGAAVIAGRDISYEIRELAFDTDYAVLLVVENSEGKKSAGNIVAQTTAGQTQATLPAAVSGLSATAGTGALSIELSWTKATAFGLDASGGDDVFKEYRIYWQEGTEVGVQGTAQATIEAEATTEYRIEKGLKDGADYAIAVVVVNSSGNVSMVGEGSQVLYTTADASTAPGKPVIDAATSSATGTEAKIQLEWTAPEKGTEANGGEASIVKYILYWKAGTTVSEDDYEGTEEAGGAASSHEIGGLEFDTDYAVVLVVENSGGKKNTSELTKVRTAAIDRTEPPGAAVGFEAIAQTDGSVDLSWAAPDSFGKGADGTTEEQFQAYRLYWEKGTTVDESKEAGHVIEEEGITSYSVSGLEGGQEYTVGIVVENSGGRRSAVRTASVRIAGEATAPEAVLDFTAVADTEELGIDLSWTVATNFGTNAAGETDTFEEYRLYWNEGQTVDTSVAADHVIGVKETSSYKIPKGELKGGTVYTIAIIVVSGSGLAGESSTAQVETKDFSVAPDGVVLSADARDDGSVRLSWTEPGSFGLTAEGAEDVFSRYHLYWEKGETVGTENDVAIFVQETLEYTIAAGELEGNAEYSIGIAVVNGGGKLSAVSSQKVATADLTRAPGAVEGFSATARTGELDIDLAWEVATDFGVRANGEEDRFGSYQLYWAQGSKVSLEGEANHIINSKEAVTYQIAGSGLEGASSYTIAIVLRTEGGQESAAVEREVETADLSTVPAAVQNLKGQAQSNGNVALSWEESSDLGKRADGETAALFKEYRLYWAVGSTVEAEGGANATITEATASHEVSGLLGSTEYTIAIVVVNDAGKASAASAVTVTTVGLAEAPAAVSDFTAVEDAEELGIDLSWREATDYGKKPDGGADLFKEYRLYWAEGQTVEVTGLADQVIADKETSSYRIGKADLEGGTEYRVAIVVVSEGGLVGAASEDGVTTRDRSTAPDGAGTLTATAEVGGIDLSWEAPGSFGNNAKGDPDEFSKYLLYWAEGSTVVLGGAAKHEITDTSSTTSYRIAAEALRGNTQYRIAVVVENKGGKQSAATEAGAVTLARASAPAAVAGVAASAKTDVLGIDVSWTEPSDFGTTAEGDADTFKEYRLYWAEGATVSVSGQPRHTIRAGAGSTSYTIDLSADQGLRGGVEYTIAVRVVNAGGEESLVEEGSRATVTTTDFSEAAAAVAGVGATAKTDVLGIDVSWTEPSDFGTTAEGDADTFKEYRLYWAEGATVSASGQAQHTISAGASSTSYTIDLSAYQGLRGGVEYTIAVTVVNGGGQESPAGAGSKATVTTTDFSTSPGLAGSIQADSSHSTVNQLKVVWTAGTKGRNREGAEVETEYDLYYAADGSYESAAALIGSEEVAGKVGAGAALEHVIENLSPNELYDVVVVSVNSVVKEKKAVSDIVSLRSNGVSAVSIRDEGGATVSGTTVSELITRTTSFALSAAVEGHNVAGTVSWETSDENVLRITGTGGTVRIEIVGLGTASITVKSTDDATKSASVAIEVGKEDIGEGDYSFGYGAISAAFGSAGTYTVIVSTLPTTNLSYRITSKTPETNEISISDAASGDITVSANAGLGSYSVEVTAEVAANDSQYKGAVSTVVSIEVAVEEEKLVYKAEMSSAAQGVFAIGDRENPYLFQVKGLEDANGVTATIAIAGGGSELYREEAVPVTYEEATGTNMVGAGFSSDSALSADLGTAGGSLSITVEVKQGEQLYADKTVTVLLAEAGALYSWRDLQAMRGDLTGNYRLEDDINFPTPGTYGFTTEGFEPIGRDETPSESEDSNAVGQGFQGTPFSGTLDGNSKTISGLYINNPDLDFAGLFGRIEVADKVTEVVKDLVLQDARITANAIAGALAGNLEMGTVKNIEVSSTNDVGSMVTTDGIAGLEAGVYQTGDTGGLMGSVSEAGTVLEATINSVVTGKNYVGGLAGWSGGIVTGSSSGKVKATGIGVGGFNAGGLVGSITGGSKVIGFSSSEVSGDDQVGGLVGFVGGALEGYFTGSVKGEESVGGLAGTLMGGSVVGYVSGTVTGNVQVGGLAGYGPGVGYSTGTVTGNDQVGGLLGDGDDTVGYATGTVTLKEGATGRIGVLIGSTYSSANAVGYWDRDGTGQDTSAYGGTGISSTDNIYIFRDTTETGGRTQNKFYDAGSGGTEAQEADDVEIFNAQTFLDAFEIPTEDKKWPKLKSTMFSSTITLSDGGTPDDTSDDIVHTLSDELYQYQSTVLGW